MTPLAAAVRAGDAAAVARAITVVETGGGAADALLGELSGSLGRAHRVGVTGPPGVGKSTLVAALARAWRDADRRVGIVAVDPTSPFTGGALLGDRIRMGALAGDPGVFVRSLATRGATGGVSTATHDVADVLDAAGYDPVVVETVGVGQDEVAIAAVADTVVVVVAPGSGDGVQAMKGGLLEAADVLVVNQADRDGADALVAELRAAVELRETGRKPDVLSTVATTGAGVSALREALDAHRGAGDGVPLKDRRRLRAVARIRDAVDRSRAGAFWRANEPALARFAAEVAIGRESVARAAATLLASPSADSPAGWASS